MGFRPARAVSGFTRSWRTTTSKGLRIRAAARAESPRAWCQQSSGAVVVAAEVDRILLDGTRAIGVRMADGREWRAGTIVSDVGFRTTLRCRNGVHHAATQH